MTKAMDVDHVRPGNSEKEHRKISKKAHKARQLLRKHADVVLSQDPTVHLVVSNGGLSNGASREDLLQIFSPFGNILNIVQEMGKPYGFVTFSSIQHAEKALQDVNGKLIKEANGNIPPLYFYLHYVSQVPGITLPSDDPPPGLVIIPDFINEEQEQMMLSSIDWGTKDAMATSDGKENLKHRRVKHYGYEFLYGINNIDKSRPLQFGLPEWCNPVIDRLLSEEHINARPDQLTVNQYLPGQGIPPHVDTHSAFEDGICSLGLGSQTIMEFRHPDGQHRAVVVPRRSMLIMTKQARYLWSHGITPRKFDVIPASDSPDNLTLFARETRTSFTFRKILLGPCICDFKEQCDSQNPILQSDSHQEEKDLPRSAGEAMQMENEHVHQVYDKIADHFSDTRHSPWPQIADFLQDQPLGALVADIGCGNGKYLGINNRTFKVGCDRSVNLCGICADRGYSVFVADCMSVPFRDNAMDVAISIAVIHHLSTPERRLDAVKEIVRILRVGGQGLIYVWAMEQKRNNVKSKYLNEKKLSKAKTEQGESVCLSATEKSFCGSDGAHFNPESILVEETKSKLIVHTNRTAFKSQDLLVPWHLKKNIPATQEDGDKLFHRFYHVFMEGELESLISAIPQVTIVKSYYDQGNWCVIFEKVR